jgi:hypothetical protein
MFSIPIVFGWVAPYVSDLIPSYFRERVHLCDLLLLVSLFVLGGDFWNKLRALFIHDAKAVIMSY